MAAAANSPYRGTLTVGGGAVALSASKRGVALLLAAAVSIALFQSVAPAATVWTPPRSLGRGQNAWIAANAAGDAIAVMQRSDPNDGVRRLYAAFRAAGDTWSEPRVIFADGGDVIEAVDVEVGPAGDATVVWTDSSSTVPNGYVGPTQHQVMAARLLGDGTWETTQLSTWRGLGSVSVATDPGGTTTVAWDEFEGCVWNSDEPPPCRKYVKTATRAPGGAWQASSLAADNAFGPTLAAAPDGMVAMVFSRRTDAASNGSELVAIVRPPGAAWGQPTVLTTAPGGTVRRWSRSRMVM